MLFCVDGRVAGNCRAGLEVGASAQHGSVTPAQVQAGTRHPGLHCLFVQFEFQPAEYRHLYSVLFRRVVYVVITPEAEVEVDLEFLARPDAFQEILHVAPYRGRQVVLAAQFPEQGFGVFVMPRG